MNRPVKPILTVCCSCAFYRQAVELEDAVQKLGYTVVLPETAHEMKRRNDYEVSHYKTWFAKEGDYPEKGRLMRAHFSEVNKADAILVLNYEKHGRRNYIGPNVLIEWRWLLTSTNQYMCSTTCPKTPLLRKS